MSFEAQALPGDIPKGRVERLPDGLLVRTVDGGFVDGLTRRLREATPIIRERPVAELVELLGHVGGRFLEDGDPLRREALEHLPRTAGVSPEMARVVLDGMAADWTVPRLMRWLQLEFAEPTCLDGLADSRGRRVMAVGPQLCTQIVSGSVPGVGVSALLRSLLVKGPTLLKPGLGDVVLPVLFARGITEADRAIGDAVAVLYWPGGSGEVERAAVRAADVVAVYGSDATVAAVRALAPPTTRVVAYHHRTSVAVLGRGALTEADAPAAAEGVARAVAMFDQRGCVCPHEVFVERGGAITPERVARLLARALDALEETLPAGDVDVDEAAAVQQLRGYAELREATGSAELHHGTGWTVIYEKESSPGPLTARRGVYVRPIDNVMDLAALLRPLGPHLQTVGHEGLGARAESFTEAVGRAGASRVTTLGSVPFPPPWWLHDGRGPLSELVRWVELAP